MRYFFWISRMATLAAKLMNLQITCNFLNCHGYVTAVRIVLWVRMSKAKNWNVPVSSPWRSKRQFIKLGYKFKIKIHISQISQTTAIKTKEPLALMVPCVQMERAWTLSAIVMMAMVVVVAWFPVSSNWIWIIMNYDIFNTQKR